MTEKVHGSGSAHNTPQIAARKVYVKPEVRLLGRMSDRTLGNIGSSRDANHNRVTKVTGT
jgi:hypothetical protein